MGAVATAVGTMFGAKNLFKTPKPPEASPPSSTSSAPVQQSAAETAQKRSRARGYRSTILSQLFMAPAQPVPLKDTIGS